eukprot:scaffold2342_cov368-Pinguiococcus_pyrenoidosus.AAC.4
MESRHRVQIVVQLHLQSPQVAQEHGSLARDAPVVAFSAENQHLVALRAEVRDCGAVALAAEGHFGLCGRAQPHKSPDEPSGA